MRPIFNNTTEPMYRQAEKEWVAFVDDFTGILTEDVDSQIPPLPAKDVIHRIYRDVCQHFQCNCGCY